MVGLVSLGPHYGLENSPAPSPQSLIPITPKKQPIMLNTDKFPYLIIDDSNAHLFCSGAPAEAARATGAGSGPTRPTPFAARGRWAPRSRASEWHDRIKAAAPGAPGQGTFLSDLVKQKGLAAKDQDGLGYCWVYGSTRAVEIQRAVQGLATLDLSPESVGGPCTHWRDTGGYASEAFDQLQNFGACESSYMNAPHSLRHLLWKPGWQQNALLHEAVDWYDIESGDAAPTYDEVITCLLNRVPVAAGLDWWGHLVCFLDPIILPDGSVGVLFQNSWGADWPTPGANGLACLTESRGTPDGAAAPIVVTVCDD